MASTPLLGLSLPADGTTNWGTLVNTSITALLDSAVAGTTTLLADSDVTLTDTDEVANQSRQAILLCSDPRTALWTITAPARSKTYVVINNTSGGYGVKLVGVGPTTGVTISASQAALVAWNGVDFVLVASTDISKLTGTLAIANGGTGQVTAQAAFNALAPSQGSQAGKYLKTDGTNASWDAIDLSTADITGTLAIANGGTGTTTAQAAMNTFAGGVASGQYLRGNGTNVVMSTIQAADVPTLNQNTTGTAAGLSATLAVASGGTGVTTSTGTGSVVLSNNPAFGTDITVNGLTVGTGPGGISNTALGDNALSSSTSGSNNVAIGQGSIEYSTNGGNSVAVGGSSMRYIQGGDNVAVGYYTLRGTVGALAQYNVAVGSNAMSYTVDGSYNTVVGPSSGIQIQNGNYNSLLGYAAGQNVNTDNNTLVGAYAGSALGTGSKNTILGSYTGNAFGLDIRYSSNYIVLSDGDGNPRAFWDAADATFNGKLTLTAAFRSAVSSVASASTITPTSNTANQYNVTALAVSAAFAAPSGTPVDGQKLLLRIKDNGTARALTWNAIYRAIGVTLPTSTTAGKTMYIDCVYNSADTKWDVTDVKVQV